MKLFLFLYQLESKYELNWMSPSASILEFIGNTLHLLKSHDTRLQKKLEPLTKVCRKCDKQIRCSDQDQIKSNNLSCLINTINQILETCLDQKSEGICKHEASFSNMN